MKPNTLLKGLAAAVGLALAGSANAALVQFNPSTGSSSLMFQAFTDTRSYGIELAIAGDVLRLDELVTLANSGTAFSLTFSLPNLAATFGAPSNVAWSVFAADSSRVDQNVSLANGTRLLQTAQANPSGVGNGETIFSSADNMQGLVTGLAPLCTTGAACIATSPAATEYLGSQFWSSNWGLPGGLDHSSPVTAVNSSVMEMFLLAPDMSTPGFETFLAPIVTALNVNGNPVTAKLDFGNNTVTISAVPVPAAVWLFGSALAGTGAIARRRKQA